MPKEKTELEKSQAEAEFGVRVVNLKIGELGQVADKLYLQANLLQGLFDQIISVPSEQIEKYKKLKEIRLTWKKQVEYIQNNNRKEIAYHKGQAVAGVGVGIAAAAMGPNIAMGIATTFGVASTGTPIALLSGAAAQNAALAWLGGGALVAEGGGMAAGNAFLAALGPAGWAIAGVSLLSTGLLILKSTSDKKRLERIFTLISKRDIKKYNLAYAELGERISKIIRDTVLLEEAINNVKSFGTNYNEMTEEQQYTLATYYNLMNSATQLLVNPIYALLPKYTEADLEKFRKRDISYNTLFSINGMKKLFISLAELLYRIPLDDTDRKVLWKALRNNKEFLAGIGIEKKNFEDYVIFLVNLALKEVY